MLTPDSLESLPDALVELYAKVEADILADMARRIEAYDYWIPAAEHQAKMLEEMGMVREEITNQLAAITGKSEKELRQLMSDAGTAALRSDDEVYRRAGLSPPPLAASEALRRTLNAGLRRTMGTFKNITATTANTAAKQFEDALDRAWLQVTSGAFDQRTATRMAIKDLAKQGVGAIKYPSGHVDNLEVAVTRAIRTGVNQTCLRLQLERADEMDCDLVEVTAHAGARPEHAAWQGQIYSRSGRSHKYPEFESSTGYGTGAGLGGWNCRHSFFPYFEGAPRAYSEKQLKEYEAKNCEYNGHKMTEYEATQHQRYIERQIRRWKREEQAMQAAGLPADEAAAKVAQWQAKQKDFIEKTGLKRRADREQIPGVRRAAAAFGRQSVPFNANASFRISIPAYSEAVNREVSAACLKTAAEGAKDGNERLVLIDLVTGKWKYEELGTGNEVGGPEFFKFLKESPGNYIFVHNHPPGGTFSISDLNTFFSEDSLDATVAAGHDGKIFAAFNKKMKIDVSEELYQHENEIIRELRKKLKDGTIDYLDYRKEAEMLKVEYILRKYTECIEVTP